MSLTNCGSKQVRKNFNRDRKELEEERFLEEEDKQRKLEVLPDCKKCGAILEWYDHPICPKCKNDEEQGAAVNR